MPSIEPPTVAIIGAGLSGLTLALALHKNHIPVEIFESRPAPLNIGGAIMLSPNALRILDNLGLYDKISHLGYNFSLSDWYDVPTAAVTERYEFGSVEKYGYDALRIHRYKLIDVLLDALKEVGVQVEYGKKFSRVVEETNESVTWEFANGESRTAGLLIGADGIHSTVRRYLYPDLTPKWTGMAGVSAAVPTKQLETEDGTFSRVVTYMHPQTGSFVIAPQKADGSEVFIGKQKKVPRELTRAEWDEVQADKEGLVRFLQEGNEDFPQVVRKAIANIPHDSFNVWPFYIVPKLDSWASEKRRVVILGDAAHAIPPSAGQGINQAFEDVYMISLLLAAANKEVVDDVKRGRVLTDALTFWQTFRQERVDKILALNAQIDLRRMPQGIMGDLKKEEIELSWLYNANFKAVVQTWVEARLSSGGPVEVARKTARECPLERLFKSSRKSC